MKYYFSFIALIILVGCQQEQGKNEIVTDFDKIEIQKLEDSAVSEIDVDKVISASAPCGALSSDEKNILQLFLADEDIDELDHTLCVLNKTENDWVVIQSVIKMLTLVEGIGFEGGYVGPEGGLTWWLDGEEEVAQDIGMEEYLLDKMSLIEEFIYGFTYTSYDCGSGYAGGVYIDTFFTKSLETIGTADDEFFQLITAIGCDNGFSSAYGDAFTYQEGLGATPYTSLGSGSFLNYFSKKAVFDKYQLQSDTFSLLKNDHAERIKKFFYHKHNKAIEIINSFPNDKLEFGDLNDCLKELNQILDANVLSTSETQSLRRHVRKFEAYVKLENEGVILYNGDDEKVLSMVAIGNEYAHILADWDHYNDNVADTVEISLYPHCGEEDDEDWKVPTFKVYDRKGLKEVRDNNPNYRILQVVIADIKENTLHLELADPMDWGHSALYPSVMEFEKVNGQLRLKKIQFEDGC